MPEYPQATTVAAAGTATLTFQHNRPNISWTVSQISCELSALAAGAYATVRKNGYFVCLMIGSGDTAGGDPPVTLFANDSLTVSWTGATSGKVATATIFYDEKEIG